MSRWYLGVLVVCAAVVLTASPLRAQDIVLNASDVTTIQGHWSKRSAQGGQYMASDDHGQAAVSSALAAPAHYFEASFSAPSFTTYHVWLRMRASSNSKWNDSVWVQFSDAATPAGTAVYRFNTSSALLVNAEACSDCGVSGWGWHDGAYWLSQNATVMFGASGTHKIRVQTREDGVEIDQIVLSPSTYMSRAPGPQSNDNTVLSRTGGAAAAATSMALSGGAISLPGTVAAQDFDNGGEGVAYHDTTSGNSGGAYRSTDVDLEGSTDGGHNIGWIDAGEWVNYTVDVGNGGSYTLQARVASPRGGSMRVRFSGNGASASLSVPNTGGWQNWTSVSVPVSLSAGRQTLTVSFDTNGINLNRLIVSSGGASTSGNGPSGSSSPYGGTAWAIPGTIEAEHYDSGGEGIAYHDSTGGNSGGEFRGNDVDIEGSSEGGYSVGWTSSGEFLNYSVNAASGGNYTVQLRVASPGGGSIRVGFNGPSSVWSPVSIPATGGWQSWTTVNLPVTLGAGRQLMTLLFETGGINLNYVKVVSGSAAPQAPPPPPASTSNRLRVMTWNIQHGTTQNGSYDPAAQARFIVSQNPDVVSLQEVETWTENQPDRYRSLLEQLTGQSWTVVWAPVMGGATEGNVLLTRLPVVSSSSYQMHATGDWTEMYANRSAAQVTVRVNGVNVSLFSTHLDYYNTSHRSTQLEQLLGWAGNFAGPRLLTGDFNSWWGEYWITRTTQNYSDTWVDVTGDTDLGYTVNGAVRFDYIFRSHAGGSRATPLNCNTPYTSLSDHYPVVADFAIQ